MLVCPSCRAANPEAAEVCDSCGKELRPTYLAIRSATRGAPVEIDLPPPRVFARWPRITALVVILAGAIGASVWFSVRPTPCDGKFASDQFDYCVTVPAGWTAAAARVGPVQVDQITRHPASAFVMSVELNAGVTLDAYAEVVCAGSRLTERGNDPAATADHRRLRRVHTARI